MNRQLLHRLGGIFDTHQILASDLYREIYSRDGSYFDIKPEVIVRPDTPAAGTTVAGYRFGSRGERHFPYRRDFVVGTEC